MVIVNGILDQTYSIFSIVSASTLYEYKNHIIHAWCVWVYVDAVRYSKQGIMSWGVLAKSFVCYFCKDDRYGLVIAFSSHMI